MSDKTVSSSFGSELELTIAEAHKGWDPVVLLRHLDRQYAQNEQWGVALGTVCIIAVGLRVWVKAVTLKAFRADDWCILVAFGLYAGLTATIFLLGRDFRALFRAHYETLGPISQALTAYNAIYVLCTIFCKTSFTLFMLNLFSRSSRWQRYTIMILLGISTLVGLVYLGFTPTCGITFLEESKGTCNLLHTTNIISIAWSVCNMLVDIVFAILCVQLIWGASMSKRNKIWASALLCFGSVGAAASVLRVITYIGLGWQTLNEQRVLIARYSTMEAGITIAAASFATLRPLIRDWFSRLMTSYGASSAGRTYGDGKSRGKSGNKSMVKSRMGEKEVFDGPTGLGMGGITKKDEVNVTVAVVQERKGKEMV
ncbi:hypothetical protein BDZ85DRAFT_91198 [Elsinoe ampelina]|uniref:Rhodopsin domain-containing protein n=1 Tax=Elsinoe ampelina TaxID=302913 RepID=A0A6A6GHT7_9PEZI|nr:hypothetical protein BDZ85DRAFT_91198 [Elsinoe ampelina]